MKIKRGLSNMVTTQRIHKSLEDFVSYLSLGTNLSHHHNASNSQSDVDAAKLHDWFVQIHYHDQVHSLLHLRAPF